VGAIAPKAPPLPFARRVPDDIVRANNPKVLRSSVRKEANFFGLELLVGDLSRLQPLFKPSKRIVDVLIAPHRSPPRVELDASLDQRATLLIDRTMSFCIGCAIACRLRRGLDRRAGAPAEGKRRRQNDCDKKHKRSGGDEDGEHIYSGEHHSHIIGGEGRLP